ncbi:Response regulator with antiterminator output domain [Modestobacter italicus]|uniref:Response regulator with antiterminator output domain n=1 Tax=Modestobacter italicus (strain DSM 44449 / CECT 9708 / BC 501) TaxID=2732864 RepID=I4ER00_MODI5|nr:GAF and ANTAR domain-containing protein [Modestobacter marinus]CCH85813.1 Response regulator with antiterminator output domain [Modestobacter marinus]
MPDPGVSFLPAAVSALQRINNLQVSRESMDTVLQAVVDETSAVLPGRVDASISVLIGTRPATAAYSGQLALDLDETQYERGHGPCLHAAETGELVEITDARSETRWPDYTPRAVYLQCLSSLSVALPADGLSAGLNIYAAEAGGFDEASRVAAGQLADAAAAAIGNMHAYQSARDVVANLEVALQSRATIDQAKGVLMERHKLTADQAFQVLVHASQAANVKLRDVADHLILTGEIATSPDRRRRH